ncbi:MAG: ribosomal RNA small subunit methyltransferase A [Methanobacteriota archaeon]|nr:MAG: ribosomal RNA small subunit methyltransferase A [Euryarchaeota archaeon]
MTLSEVKERLREMGLRPSKKLGQHFLIDETIANRQVQYADVGKGDIVLEIGPGLGTLTRILAKRAKKVIAVELDSLIAEYLKKDLPDVEIIQGDILKIEVPEFDKVVSNLPFKISSPVTFKLLGHEFKEAILMYQKEFAQRLVANKGDPGYSRLSVNAYYKARCETLETVPKSAFYPEPKVDSSIVRMTPRQPTFDVEDEEHFYRLVKALFTHRRKKIGNSLLLAWRELCDSEESMSNIISDLPSSDMRVEQLSPEDMGDLSNKILHGKV